MCLDWQRTERRCMEGSKSGEKNEGWCIGHEDDVGMGRKTTK
jgi:hypothetical protein